MHAMPRSYPRYVLAVMVGINFLNYLDRYILPAVATKIQAEFHLTDGQVGLLGSAFLLVYAVATIPFGIWADRGVRKTVIGIGVTIWSLATLFTGLARNYAQLFAARAVMGIGEGRYYPAGTAMIGGYFNKEGRGRAMGVLAAGLSAAAFRGGRGTRCMAGGRRARRRAPGRLTPGRNDRRPACCPTGRRKQPSSRNCRLHPGRRLRHPGPGDAQPGALRA